MISKLKYIILIFACLIFCGESFSQTEDEGGSPYSIFGIGDINYFTSMKTYSMGILGTSLAGNYVNNLNPASMTLLTSTVIALDFNYGFLSSSDNVRNNEVSNGNILGINIGIPFDQGRGWGLSLGFNPVSLVSYKIKTTGTAGQQTYIQTYSGKGGLSRINIGMSYYLNRKVSIGLEYNYAFGEIRSTNFVNFLNTNYTNSTIKNQTDFQKSFVKGGLIFDIGKIFNSNALRDFSIGFVYQSALNLNASKDGIFKSSLSTDTMNLNSGVIGIPASYGAGITNIFGGKYIVSGDVQFQNWEDFSVFGVKDQIYQTSMRAGLGMEILPAPTPIDFFGKLTYRFGLYYDKAFFKVKGHDINTYGLRLGTNVPLSQYNSLDFAISYSIRGRTSDGLIKDEFLNFAAGLNFGELWFIRPRDEDQ